MSKVLVLDAGHGGADPGAVSVYNGRLVKEKVLAWELCVRVRQLCEKRKDLKVVIVPHGGVFDVPNRNRFAERVKFAKEQKPTHFVSVHFNSFSNKNATGVETFFRGNEHAAFAGSLSFNVSQEIGLQNRGHKQDSRSVRGRLAILSNHGNYDACLLEVCFISNPNDLAKYFRYVDDVAQSIIDTVLRD
jgi:N-acetylmuramoyl-L-alanine amidase